MSLPSNLLPNDASPEWMNKGDNASQLTAATLVGLQSVPGLVILYGSIVKKKWVVNSAFMTLYAFAAVLLCWVGHNGVLGITLTLIAGTLLGRMNFYAWMLFVPLWLTFSYTIGAFSLWSPSGWLAKAGVIEGMITGLVCITPAAGSIPWYTMMVLHKKIRLLKQVDDTMAVFHTHAIAESLGGILTGFFAEPKLNRLFYMVDDWEKYIRFSYGLQTGRITAGFRQMGIQLGGILFVTFVNIITTSLICMFIRLIVPLRLSDEDLLAGDGVILKEEDYALQGDREKFENSKHNSVYDVEDFPSGMPRDQS
ncbi:hypothetical protein HHK36_022650 [Tetracentron sinense]|uniref:Ammonium transporter AmtB-like domain-containing protein n=1 Tax=Tetracentron sinense TaxID=13715 RepID=A0A835D6I7_TETSI|nr:hypothetical protein HHK36_022650 [Tetracentron sinense]